MTTTSINVQELRERIGEKAKADPHHRFWGLYTHVWKLNILEEAYRLARKNHGASGVDGVTFQKIEATGREEFLERSGAQEAPCETTSFGTSTGLTDFDAEPRAANEDLSSIALSAGEDPQGGGKGEAAAHSGHP